LSEAKEVTTVPTPTMDVRLLALKDKHGHNRWAGRILAELKYAWELSRFRDHEFHPLIEAAVSRLEKASEEEGTISRSLVLEIENDLMPISGPAKQLTV